LPAAKPIYPPLADSNGNSGILPPPFGRTKPLKRFGSASCRHPSGTSRHPCRILALEFCEAKFHLSACGGEQ
jgi:hypothetical protein